MPDGGQEDVAAGFIWLGFDGEAQVVLLRTGRIHKGGRRPPCTGRARHATSLAASDSAPFSPSPHDESLCPHLGRQVQVAQRLAQGEAPYGPVVGGEAALFEHRVGEEVGRDHGDDDPGLVQRRNGSA